MSSHQTIVATYGEDGLAKLRAARVLVIGAGGIGCELLSVLVRSAVGHIEVIDLDTIDVSNLNRQFLFTRDDVGKSKALVAAEAARRLVGDEQHCTIVGHHANVKESRFGVEYVRTFSVVVNGLDNVAARQHMNRVCLAADVPMIESGTAGFRGQTMVIRRGATECYDCRPRTSGRRMYPVCTIRSTPSKPVHTVVWAKEELKRLFNSADIDTVATDEEMQVDRDEFVKAGERECERIRREHGDARADFYRLFCHDIRCRRHRAQRDGRNPWSETSPPEPIAFEAFDSEIDGNTLYPNSSHRWSLSECAHAFVASYDALAARSAPIEFDKDDDDTMRFVAAASLLRARCYSIVEETPFELKSIAGNIVPAIGTTNAVIAGLAVLETLKVIVNDGRVDACRQTFFSGSATRRLMTSVALDSPNAECFVCSSSRATVTLDTRRRTLDEFIRVVLVDRLGFGAPEISVVSTNRIVYECDADMDDDDDEREDNTRRRALSLHDAGLVHNTVASIDDYHSDQQLELTVVHRDDDDDKESSGSDEWFDLRGDRPVAATPAKRARDDDDNDDGGCEIVR